MPVGGGRRRSARSQAAYQEQSRCVGEEEYEMTAHRAHARQRAAHCSAVEMRCTIVSYEPRSSSWQFPSPEVGAHSPGAITTALSFAGRTHKWLRAPFGLKDDWCCHCAAVVPATRTVTKLRPTPAVCRVARSHDANQLQSSCFLEKDTTLQREHLRQRRAQEARSSMPCSAADHMP